MMMDEVVQREAAVQGKPWDAIHGGYFSRRDMAEPFLARVRDAVARSQPRTVVDLGGGTGFILEKLIEEGIDSAIQLVDLDESRAQLSVVRNPRIRAVEESIATFTRAELMVEARRGLFIARSVLHYFGRDGLPGALAHIRAQMHDGEFFVHQTACFTEAADAERLNRVYVLMGNPKWYPATAQLEELLRRHGWRVESVSPAPALELTSADLMNRYAVDSKTMAHISSSVMRDIGARPGMFEPHADGFTAWLHYSVFVCIA